MAIPVGLPRPVVPSSGGAAETAASPSLERREDELGSFLDRAMALNIVIDTIFIVDVLVNFNTTFMLGYDVIYDRKLIAR